MKKTIVLLLGLILCCAAFGAEADGVYIEDGWALIADAKTTWRIDLADGSASRVSYEGYAEGFCDMGEQVIFLTAENGEREGMTLRSYDKAGGNSFSVAFLGDGAEVVGTANGLLYYLERNYDGTYTLRAVVPTERRDRYRIRNVRWAGLAGDSLLLIRQEPHKPGEAENPAVLETYAVDGSCTGTLDENIGPSALAVGDALFCTLPDPSGDGVWICRFRAPWQEEAEKLFRLRGRDAQVRFLRGVGSRLTFCGRHLADDPDALFLFDPETGGLQTLDTRMDAEAARLFADGDSLYWLNALGEMHAVRPEENPAAPEKLLQFPAGTELLGVHEGTVYYRVSGSAYAAALPGSGAAEAEPSAKAASGAPAGTAAADELRAALGSETLFEIGDSPVWTGLNEDPERKAVFGKAAAEGLNFRFFLTDEQGRSADLRFTSAPAAQTWTIDGVYTANGKQAQASFSRQGEGITLRYTDGSSGESVDLSFLNRLFETVSEKQRAVRLITETMPLSSGERITVEAAQTPVVSIYFTRRDDAKQENGKVYHVPLNWDTLTALFREVLDSAASLYGSLPGSSGNNPLSGRIGTLTESFATLREQLGSDPVLDIYITDAGRLRRVVFGMEEAPVRYCPADRTQQLLPARKLGGDSEKRRGLRLTTDLLRDRTERNRNAENGTPAAAAYREETVIRSETEVCNGMDTQRSSSSLALTMENRPGLAATESLSLMPSRINVSHYWAESRSSYGLSISLSGLNARLALNDLRAENGRLTAEAALQLQAPGMENLSLTGTFEMGGAE